MKRPVGVILAVAAIAIGVYFIFFKKDKKEEGPKDQPLAIGENTGTFNQSYDQLLASYFQLKDALVASDTTKANTAANTLLMAADSLKTNEIKGDSASVEVLKSTAKDFAGTISGSSQALVKEAGLDAKRKEFEIITEAMYSLTRVVKYAGQKIYYQYCPMAFNNKGAYWLSAERDIKNPYFGDEMLTCGSVEDSLDYSKK